MPIWKSILTRADAVAALMVLAAIVAAALLAPVVSPDGPWRMVARPFQLPFQDMVHPLGADALGRDMLAMMMYGARTSLGIGLVSTAVAIFLGLSIGGMAGFFGGRVDSLLMRGTEMFQTVHGSLTVGLGAAAGDVLLVRGGTSSNQKALFFNLRRLRARLSGMEAGTPRATMHRQISETLRVPQKDVELMDARLSGSDVSLNITAGPDETGNERMDFLVSDAPGPDELAQQTIDSERQVRWLHSALNVLNDRELHIVRQRRLTEDGVTLEALGAELGISKERVRQIEARALSKLHTALEQSDPRIASSYTGNV